MLESAAVKIYKDEDNIVKFASRKYKKDGSLKKTKCNKKRGRKSEVYPFEITDIKKIMDYFIENENWNYYLIFVMGCNMARRIGDTLSLTWEHIYNPDTGEMRTDLLEIVEDKTDKLANPRINSAVRDAINLYIEKTGCNPAENNYQNFVFTQLTGNYKGRVLSAEGYRRTLKKAATAVGINYNVGTHSTRKTFGKINRILHPNDYDSMVILKTIFNHSDIATTERYIGLTKEKTDKYYNDMGEFFGDYITGDKEFSNNLSNPIISLDTNDLRDVIKSAYESGLNNSGNSDPMTHIEAINIIISMVESLAK